ncbi:MAG: S41 family peptidase, partial [Vicinamibacteria bacterium]
VSEMEPGLWYVDLTRASMADVTSRLDALAVARGVVFDVRGYPTDAGAGILPHLLDAPETDRWMHVAKIVGPFGEAAGWFDFGWDLKPAAPHIAGRVVFLTDGSAISYAESVMGYVADRHLATIVGRPTAGTNGNVASFVTPSGFRVSFTGMRVTRHDGRSPHHLVGVEPDVALAPTLAGIRAGRDEVLERGVQLARAPATASKPRKP